MPRGETLKLFLLEDSDHEKQQGMSGVRRPVASCLNVWLGLRSFSFRALKRNVAGKSENENEKILGNFLTTPKNRHSVSIVNVASNPSQMQPFHESQHEENNERMQPIPGRRLLQLSRFSFVIGVKLVDADNPPVTLLYCHSFSDGGLPLGNRPRWSLSRKNSQALVGNGKPLLLMLS